MTSAKAPILLIEDDADDAELTFYALRKRRIAAPIVHINDGEKALAYLFGTQPRPVLVLLDLKMPRVDGLDILQRLKEDPSKRSIPVVALISFLGGKNYVEASGVQADGYIVKPVDFKQFSATIDQLGLRSQVMDEDGVSG